MDTLLSFLIGLMQRKLKFVAILGTLFIGVMLYVQGFTMQNIIFTIIFVVITGLFALTVWFWTTIFKSIMTKRR
ncbi:hypothetical protein RPMA_17095 [Tardiphaga alba]|uniref:Uncharacterized protein n=1 Tax=Tardiphaga alba TaxID=340268 RepID=A0ABX8ABM7_9BRAD|nr:hypothetical protein [Tardiphaga alba]QUS40361.1 hypothetical protein RPMA_17095 [Tardiphaga alba]